MLFQTLRWTVIITLWRKYKGNILLSALCLISMVFLQFLHSDYLHFQSLKTEPNETEIAISFGIKWFLNLGLLLSIYWLWRPAKKVSNEGHKSKRGQGGKLKDSILSAETSQQSQDDPFDKIRAKDKLRSKADFLMEEKED